MENHGTRIDWFQSGTIGKLAEALSKAQGVMKPIKKEHENTQFRSTYAGLEDVWEGIRKPLSDNGLAVIQFTSSGGERPTLMTLLAHSSGEWVRGEIDLILLGQPRRDGGLGPINSQSQGSAITYMRRYMVQAITGAVVTNEDDDGEAAVSDTNARTTQANRISTPAAPPKSAPAPHHPPVKESIRSKQPQALYNAEKGVTQIDWNEKWPFKGKNEGKLIKDIPQDYFEWLLKQMADGKLFMKGLTNEWKDKIRAIHTALESGESVEEFAEIYEVDAEQGAVGLQDLIKLAAEMKIPGDKVRFLLESKWPDIQIDEQECNVSGLSMARMQEAVALVLAIGEELPQDFNADALEVAFQKVVGHV